jgi:hypothetical protein
MGNVKEVSCLSYDRPRSPQWLYEVLINAKLCDIVTISSPH